MKTKKFDLSTGLNTVAACNAGTTIDILDANQNKTGIRITILGKDSDTFRDTQRENIDAHNRRVALARSKGKPVPIQTMADQETEGTDLLVACTTGWENVVIDDAEIEFTVQNARMLYTKFPEVRRQVDAAIMDLELFTKS